MPIYTIETPGGRKLKIEAETQEAALAGARQWHESQPKAKPVGAVFQPGKDLVDPIVRAWRTLGSEVGKGASGDPLAVPGLGLGLMEGVSNQITGPASRALAKYGPQAFEHVAAPWEDRFGQMARPLEGADAAAAIKGDLDTAMMGMRPGAKGLKPLPPKVAKPLAPDVRAARAIDRAMKRDLAAGDMPDVAPGALPIHAGGDNLMRMGDVLANSPGAGGRLIKKELRTHEARSVDRTKADISRDLGGRNDFFETQENLINARKAAADEGMSKIEGQFVTLDPDSVMALRSDLAKGAIRERALNALASPDPAIRNDGARLMRLSDELLDKPGAQTITVRDAQDISRSLLEGAKSAYAGGNGGRGGALKDLGKAIRSNASTPERGGHGDYGEWLKKFGDDMSREEALDLGRDMFGNKQNAEQLRRAVDEMSETERALFQKGGGEALLAKVRGTRGDVGAMRDMLNSEENAERLALAFPDDQSFASFMESAARRVEERDINNKILNGSPTAPRLAAEADLKDTGFGGEMFDAASKVVTGRPASGAAQAAKAALKDIPFFERGGFKKHVLNDPAANLAASRAMVDPDEMTRLLNTLQAGRARDARLRAILQRAAPLLLETGAASSEGQR